MNTDPENIIDNIPANCSQSALWQAEQNQNDVIESSLESEKRLAEVADQVLVELNAIEIADLRKQRNAAFRANKELQQKVAELQAHLSAWETRVWDRKLMSERLTAAEIYNLRDLQRNTIGDIPVTWRELNCLLNTHDTIQQLQTLQQPDGNTAELRQETSETSETSETNKTSETMQKELQAIANDHNKCEQQDEKTPAADHAQLPHEESH